MTSILDSISRALVVVAHPDDEVLGAGGTIARLTRRGVPVTLAVVTDGSSAQHGDDMRARTARNDSLDAAASRLGIAALHHGTFPDMRLDTVPHIEINHWIGSVLATEAFDTVLFHHAHDVNLDHTAVHRSVLVCCRPQSRHGIRNLLTFPVASSTEWGATEPHRLFWPNIYVDITETLSVKLAAMQDYRDELREYPHPRSLEAIESLARAHGQAVCVAAAEPFQLIRSVVW